MTDKWGRLTAREKSDIRCYWMANDMSLREDTGEYDYKCFHPMNFRYCIDMPGEDGACEYYQPNHEPSETEEEIRQFLEYTE